MRTVFLSEGPVHQIPTRRLVDSVTPTSSPSDDWSVPSPNNMSATLSVLKAFIKAFCPGTGIMPRSLAPFPFDLRRLFSAALDLFVEERDFSIFVSTGVLVQSIFLFCPRVVTLRPPNLPIFVSPASPGSSRDLSTIDRTPEFFLVAISPIQADRQCRHPFRKLSAREAKGVS